MYPHRTSTSCHFASSDSNALFDVDDAADDHVLYSGRDGKTYPIRDVRGWHVLLPSSLTGGESGTVRVRFDIHRSNAVVEERHPSPC